MIKYGLGLVPDPPDERDFLLSSFLPLAATVPERFSIRNTMTPCKNQGSLGSCVAFSFAGMKEKFDSEEYQKEMDLSEQYLHNKCKETDGFPNEEGTTPRTALSILTKNGICEELYFPYEERYPTVNTPSQEAEKNATNYKIATYARVATDVESIKQALYQNGPVSCGVNIYDSFYSSRVNGGFVPEASGRLHGGHCMVVVGWDDQKQWSNYQGFLEIRNSWGSDWGDNGYVWMPYTVYNNIQLAHNWTIVDQQNIIKHWADWPDTELTAQDLVYKRGIFVGDECGRINPWMNMSKRHVALVMARLGLSIAQDWFEDYSVATRGWVQDKFPFFDWKEERWEEPISRYQFILLLSRKIASKEI